MSMPGPEQIAEFSRWLEKRNVVIEEPTNPWEALRFRRGTLVSVMYRKSGNRRGKWTGEASEAWAAFRKGTAWPTRKAKPKTKSIPGRLDFLSPDAWTGFWCTLHCDASGSPDAPPMAWGAWATIEGEKFFPSGECPPDLSSTTESELYGIVEALRATLERWPKLQGILVVCDNRDAIRALATDFRPKRGRERIAGLVEEAHEMLGDRWAVWRWQKGHRADGTRSAYVNRLVDRAAKRARRRAMKGST